MVERFDKNVLGMLAPKVNWKEHTSQQYFGTYNTDEQLSRSKLAVLSDHNIKPTSPLVGSASIFQELPGTNWNKHHFNMSLLIFLPRQASFFHNVLLTSSFGNICFSWAVGWVRGS